MRGLLKALAPAWAKRLLYRAPQEQLKRLRVLGLAGYFLLDHWSRQMERSVATLPPLAGEGEPVDLWFLTGNRFWYQTAYCAWTFGWHARRPVRLHLVDDGSLRPAQVEALARLFGPVDVVAADASRARLATLLPSDRYPMLNRRWLDYIHLRKVIDVHLGGQGPRLVLDSDMLFFARPDLLLDWLDSGDDRPLLYMTDCEESYGYSRARLERLAGAALPVMLNVGICGLSSERLDWDRLEAWSSDLVGAEGTSYFLEQALVAMMAAREPGVQAPASAYITLPTPAQVRAGEGVLQHYVASSKSDYFRHAWRLARARCGV